MRADDRGFILLESSITLVICSLALFSFLILFALVIRGNQRTAHTAVAAQLASSLMDEVLLRRWDQGTPIPPRAIRNGGPIGPEAGETNKLTFNDIDDFNDWTESPPVGPMMEPLPGFSAFTRKVSVEYVDANLFPSPAPTNYKHVRVCAWDSSGMPPLCLDTLSTNR